MIEQHMDYVKGGARKHYRLFGGKVPFEDLVAFGYIGLTIAARRWREDGGATFRSYAYTWIDGHLKEAGQQYRRQHGWNYEASQSEKAAGHKGMIQRVSFMQWPNVNNDEGSEQPIDVPDPNAKDAELDVVQNERRTLALSVLSNPRDKLIFISRMKGETWTAIGERVGLSRQGVLNRFNELMPIVQARVQERLAGAEGSNHVHR